MKQNIAASRAAAIQSLASEPLDVLVIGGGIVGAGVARDAAMRGLHVGLVEQHDFAFGTSSRSSRLLHGGIRYLAQGKVRLVRQASVEKKILHSIAPHLTDPLPFIFPTFRKTDWPLWQLRIGVKIYDLLCSGKNLGRSSSMNRTEVGRLLPQLTGSGLTGAVRYFDGFTNDARLVLDTLRSAARAGAFVVNYCQYLSASQFNNLWRCEARDGLSGHIFSVSAHAVINATGPWADGLQHSSVKLRLTKGIHLVIERKRLPVQDAVVLSEGKRILFVLPWGERVIVGTTDTDYSGSLENVRAEQSDIEYLLGVLNEFFPSAKISQSDVISTWAGLRPLLADQNGKPSDISRSHEIRSPEPGWWDVAGGKLTTYRLMAEETVDRIIEALQPMKQPIGKCRTAEEPLCSLEETKGISGILPPEFSRSVVEHFCANEWAVHLDDVMIRRTSWAYYFADAKAKAERVADWMVEILEWPPEKRQAELTSFLSVIGCKAEMNASSSPQNKLRDAQNLPVV